MAEARIRPAHSLTKPRFSNSTFLSDKSDRNQNLGGTKSFAGEDRILQRASRIAGDHFQGPKGNGEIILSKAPARIFDWWDVFILNANQLTAFLGKGQSRRRALGLFFFARPNG